MRTHRLSSREVATYLRCIWLYTRASATMARSTGGVTMDTTITELTTVTVQHHHWITAGDDRDVSWLCHTSGHPRKGLVALFERPSLMGPSLQLDAARGRFADYDVLHWRKPRP